MSRIIDLQVLDNVAMYDNLRYSENNLTPSGTTTVTVPQLSDRAINVITLDDTVTYATITLPNSVNQKARDFMINLTFGNSSSTTGSLTLTITEPGGVNAPPHSIDVGADTLGDIDIGHNIIMFTEISLPTEGSGTTHWFVNVKHDDFAN